MLQFIDIRYMKTIPYGDFRTSHSVRSTYVSKRSGGTYGTKPPTEDQLELLVEVIVPCHAKSKAGFDTMS